MNAIMINNARFGYHSNVPVLNGIDLAILERDFVGLIGPNGSGKTTVLRLINKTIPVRAATVSVFGQDVATIEHKSLARIVGTVGQDTESPFAFSVKQMVMMGRSPYLARWAKESAQDIKIVDSALAQTDTLELADRPISELSGGERQRVMIAQALAQEPRILLLDEPTSHLDIKHQLSILKLIKALNTSGMTIMAVFHDLKLAARYCDKLALLNHGKIVAYGSPEVVLTQTNLFNVYGISPIIERRRGIIDIEFFEEDING